MLKIVEIIVMAIIVFVYVNWQSDWKFGRAIYRELFPKKTVSQTSTQPQKFDYSQFPTNLAQALFDEIEINPAAANQRFKNQPVRIVGGKIERIDS